MVKSQTDLDGKLQQLKEIFNSDVVVTIGVQKKTGQVDLLNCEKSHHVELENKEKKGLIERLKPSYLG